MEGKPFLEAIVEENMYLGILAQDGWETLELTIRGKYPKGTTADKIIHYIEKNYDSNGINKH